MSPLSRITVFCASSPGIDQVYFEAAAALAAEFSENDIAVNYGGGGRGLMGQIADVMLEKGGSIRGYIPGFMIEMEWAHPGVEDMVVVKDMNERKYLLSKEVDAVVALPGGVGTMDELMEIITLKQLGQFPKPVIILNTNNYYDPLLRFMEQMVEQKFMRNIHRKIWTVVNHPHDVIDAIRTAPLWDSGAIKFAAVEKD